ncbi:hypothetical protein SBOR_9929 [Sclerotinia borealis F-4128]|uniref:Uncharacterized protein n=1 Tax=Sclerotinia borealis (strain F-4128) TaxID=1432307 RepID=W9BYL2_SCLBF|nr:hypothetical protein SBOR_9929 [Sclerotinia borealis F-4128]
MTSTSSIVVTSTDQPLELKDSSSSSVADSWQSDNEFLNNFDLHKYSADASMDMLFEEFCTQIDSSDEKDVQPVKEASSDLAQPSSSGVLDSTMKVPSDLSAETTPKLSIPTCPVATGVVDNEGVCESESLPNILEASVSRVLDETACESESLSKDSEESEVADDEAIVSKPSEVETEQLNTTISVQHLPELVVIDLTESSGEESTPSVTLRKVQKDQNLSSSKSSITSSKKRKRCEASNSTSTSESQDDLSPTGRRTRPKTSFRKHLSNENVFLTSSVEDIEELLEENEQEMALVERKRVRLIALKKKFLAWGAHDQKVTREWEGIV